MATHSNIENMEMMHFMCQREVEQLQRNLTRYLLDSGRMRHFITSYSTDNNDNGHMSGYTLMAYDSYMSNMETIIDMARKFNIHLQLKKLSKAVTDSCEAPHRSFQEYLQWNMYREQHAKNYEVDVKVKAVDNASGQQQPLKFPLIENIEPPAEPAPAATTMECDASYAQRKVRFTDIAHTNLPLLQHKNLSEFVENYEFTATISYVEDYEQLVFYICQLNNTELLELSSMFHLQKLQSPPTTTSNAIFGLSIHSDRILRAIVLADSSSTPPAAATKVLLIDFGEVVTLDDACVLYQLPIKYQNIPVQAIKCILLGVNEEQKRHDRLQLGHVLCQNEFKRCSFRVVRNFGRVLHVLYLLKEPSKKQKNKTIMPAGIERDTPSNPFLFSSEDEDDLRAFEDEDPSEVAVPLSALPKSKTFNKENIPITLQKNTLTLPDAELESNASSNDLDSTSPPFKNIKLRQQLTDDSYMIITATYVADVECFYAQIEENPLQPLDPLTWNDEQVTNNARLEQPPQLNDLVLAKYNKDECWYRARILEIDEKRELFKVFYVDYGNNEIIKLTSMAKCFCTQTQEPFRAVRCRLADVCSITDGDEMRLQQALDLICLIILNQTFAVKVLKKCDKEMLIRIIDEEYAEVTKNLIRLGYAKEIESRSETEV